MTQLDFISVMGTETTVDATIDFVAKKVFVDYDNLVKMANGVLDACLTSEAEDIDWAKRILSSPAIDSWAEATMYDVTDVSDWQVWVDMNEDVFEALAKAPYHDHFGQPTQDPRCELGLCVDCIDSALTHPGAKYRPALSIGSRLFMESQEHRTKVIEAFRVAGIPLLEDLKEPPQSRS